MAKLQSLRRGAMCSLELRRLHLPLVIQMDMALLTEGGNHSADFYKHHPPTEGYPSTEVENEIAKLQGLRN